MSFASALFKNSLIALTFIFLFTTPATAVDKTRKADIRLADKKDVGDLLGYSSSGQHEVRVLSMAFYPTRPCLSETGVLCVDNDRAGAFQTLPDFSSPPPYNDMRLADADQHIMFMNAYIAYSLTKGTSSTLPGNYNPNIFQQNFVGYSLKEHLVYHQPVPPSPDFEPYYDHIGILNAIDVCHYVDDLGIQEIWIWGPHNEELTPPLVPIESNMSMGRKSRAVWNHGNYGDISNSSQYDDLIQCENSYTVYNYNYGRTVREALHDHMHQYEKLFGFADGNIFWNLFAGNRRTGPICGNTHNPPNTVFPSEEREEGEEYDYDSLRVVTDICTGRWFLNVPGEDPKPYYGPFVNCEAWGCDDFIVCEDCENNGYYEWWTQRMPNTDCAVPVAEKPGHYYRNWWQAIYDFEGYFADDTKYYLSTRNVPDGGTSLTTDQCGDAPEPPRELVKNGDFSEKVWGGKEGWWFNSANPKNRFEVKNETALIKMERGNLGYSLLYQENINFEEGKTYKLSVRLKSTRPATGDLIVTGKNGRVELSMPVEISKKWRTMTAEFTVQQQLDRRQGKLTIRIKNMAQKNTVRIDDVSIMRQP